MGCPESPGNAGIDTENLDEVRTKCRHFCQILSPKSLPRGAVRHVTRPESPPTRSYGPVGKIVRKGIPPKRRQKNIFAIFGWGLVFARADPNFLRRFSELSRNFPQKWITFLKTSENADTATYPDHLITPSIKKDIAF